LHSWNELLIRRLSKNESRFFMISAPESLLDLTRFGKNLRQHCPAPKGQPGPMQFRVRRSSKSFFGAKQGGWPKRMVKKGRLAEFHTLFADVFASYGMGSLTHWTYFHNRHTVPFNYFNKSTCE
jgi:hypothetical protein